MTVSKCALVVAVSLSLAAGPLPLASPRQAAVLTDEASMPPMSLSLADAVKMSLENNLDMKVARYTPQIREQDAFFQEAAFDPNLGFSALYRDFSFPTQNVFDVSVDPNAPGTAVEVLGIDGTFNEYSAGFRDPLRWGASYTADLIVQVSTSDSANQIFPTTYRSALEFAYNQSFLRNFGRDANETQIVIAQTNHEIGRSQFRDQVYLALQQTEDAYWELVFARQDLQIKQESLRLAEELLKLNRIKVQVGTLPPIEITTAEAEVANREQAVIVGENAIRDAEDVLRRTLNMPREDQAWQRPITPTDEPSFVERTIDLQKEFDVAAANRPDLEQARLNLKNADTRLAFDHNQLRWDLLGRATYSLEGLAGDIPPPGMVLGTTVPTQNQNAFDAMEFIQDFEFPTWSIGAFLSIPVGNNAAQAIYAGSRLAKEQSQLSYDNARLNAAVEVRTFARAITTNKKRIEAAEKNIELQRKKVEAEQKKFENGMSTSFQVLEFQEDLTTALGTKYRALADYRKSLTALERAKGTLDDYLNVAIQ